MRHTNLLVLGGSGFIGRYVVNLLVARGCNVLVPSRRRDRARHLILLPTCDVVDANIMDDVALDRLVAGRDAVINLVGILHGSQTDFQRVHVDLPRRVAAACTKHRVDRLLHVSALGAGASAPSMYLRSKAMGQEEVEKSAAAWTVFRPSVVFGVEDHFLNLFAGLAAWFPVLPIGGATARFQPVWVEDVARAIANCVDNDATYRKSYELAGPRIYTLRELVEFAARAAGHPRPVIALPDGLARWQARLMELLPGPTLLSRDNLDSMKVDNVASQQPFKPARELGIGVTPMEPEAAFYLAGMHPRTRFSPMRTRARR
ncbi:MAG TPA: complex I NDUFA9 subunit family protein [Burkholderiaceae bacterium]|nr:complex I NDUFA9 subunit family protein [Burkholderiaceae bacterium]